MTEETAHRTEKKTLAYLNSDDAEILAYINNLMTTQDDGYLPFRIYDSGLFCEITKAYCMAAAHLAGITPDKRRTLLCELDGLFEAKTATEAMKLAILLTD